MRAAPSERLARFRSPVKAVARSRDALQTSGPHLPRRFALRLLLLLQQRRPVRHGLARRECDGPRVSAGLH